MTTVTGMTATAMEAIRDGVVVDGDVVGDNLILTKYDGSTINAGNVRGAQGPVGPAGLSFLNALTNQSVLEVGMSGQIKAGHKLRLVDFSTLLGLPTVPVGLWNLTNLANLGSGGNLVNKNAVTFVSDILGVAGEAAQLRGASGTPANDPVLYIDDTGAADPFRIKTGTIGCWFKSPKRGLTQSVITKIVIGGASADISYQLYVLNNNTFNAACYAGGASWSVGGITDICDDKWHHAVITYDAHFIRLYLDGVLEAIAPMGGVISPTGFGPFNIGGFGGNAGNNVSQPFYGRVDEAFVTTDILNEEQVRLLYCAAIPHGYGGGVPKSVIININRRRKGAAIVAGDFPNQPLRGYNLDNLNDFGSNAVNLTANPSTGAIAQASGPDGTKDTARRYTGSHQGDSGTDAGLPTTGSRSMGAWFKTTGASEAIVSYGTASGEGTFALRVGSTGLPTCDTFGTNRVSGLFPVNDGQWHHIAVTYDITPTDQLRFKLYIDGKLVDSQVGAAITTVLAGANRFRIGAYPDGTMAWSGEIARAFLYQGVLTESQIRTLMLKSGQDLGPSPKEAGDHVEGMDATYVYGVFDSVESQHRVNLAVAA